MIIWKPIPGHPTYEVSDQGSVRNTKTGRLKLTECKGYLVVTIQGRQRKVHQLVLEAFICPKPKGMQCRHYPNRDKTNNRLSNLQWGTAKQNSTDRVEHKTQIRGEKHHSAKLTEFQVLEIRSLYAKGGVTQKQVADIYGVHSHLIHLIVKNKIWTHLTIMKNTDFRYRRGNGFHAKNTTDQVQT